MVDKPKKIWLINFVSMPPNLEVRIQTQKKAQYLKEKGWDVTVFGGSFIHNTGVNLITDDKKYIENNYDGVKYVQIKNSNYTSNGIKRMLSLMEFYIRLYFISNKFEKPDVIEQVAAVPFSNLIYFLAKKYKALFVVNVVDLWPESFVAYGLVSKSNLLLKLAYQAEKWLYKRAEVLIFSMEGGKDYIQEKGWQSEIPLEKVRYLNNGVDLSDFNENISKYQIEDKDLTSKDTFKVLYLGSIRKANNLFLLVQAAAHLKHIENIKFLIYGDGDERPFLEEYCAKNALNNIIFKEKRVGLEYVPFILSNSSLNILNYQSSSILRFGGSQSKSFQYMASGRPICGNVDMEYNPITKYNLGICQNFESSEDYSSAILHFYNLNKEQYDEICNNARTTAKLYDYKNLTDSYENILLEEWEKKNKK